MTTIDTENLLNNATRTVQGSKQSKQSEKVIFNNCKKKYQETKKHLEILIKKKEKLEDEISHLQQKQADRKKFLSEVQKRHQSN
jgi:predicted nuclease with TOPRIM domain